MAFMEGLSGFANAGVFLAVLKGLLALVVFAVLGAGGVWLWHRRQHNILVIVEEEREENNVKCYTDRAKIYREESKIKLHLWGKNININPVAFEDIKIDIWSGLSFMHLLKKGADDYYVAKTDFKTTKVQPLEDDVRLWYVESYKETERKNQETGLSKWMPMISMALIGFVMIIAIWVIGDKFGVAATSASSMFERQAQNLKEIATLNQQAAQFNLRLAQAIGMIARNETVIPLGG